MLTQGRAKRKPTGARYVAYRGKRKYESGKQPTLTKIGTLKSKSISGMGNTKKTKLLVAEFANVLDKKTKKFSKSKIKNVVENPANRHFIRRNILTKGSVIETDAGKARVTSRPGQDGIIDAVLI